MNEHRTVYVKCIQRKNGVFQQPGMCRRRIPARAWICNPGCVGNNPWSWCLWGQGGQSFPANNFKWFIGSTQTDEIFLSQSYFCVEIVESQINCFQLQELHSASMNSCCFASSNHFFIPVVNQMVEDTGWRKRLLHSLSFPCAGQCVPGCLHRCRAAPEQKVCINSTAQWTVITLSNVSSLMLIYEKNRSDLHQYFMISTMMPTLIHSFVPWKTQVDKMEFLRGQPAWRGLETRPAAPPCSGFPFHLNTDNSIFFESGTDGPSDVPKMCSIFTCILVQHFSVFEMMLFEHLHHRNTGDGATLEDLLRKLNSLYLKTSMNGNVDSVFEWWRVVTPGT